MANNENPFSQEFAKRSIPYQLCDFHIATQQPLPVSLVLTVNLDLKTAELLKSGFPRARVVACHGGKKNFAAFFTLVHDTGIDNHDYYFFSSWDNFFDLLGQELERQPKIFRSVDGQRDRFHLALTPGEDDLQTDARQQDFLFLLKISIDYLTWYLQWLQTVERTDFNCLFDYPLTGKDRHRPVRQLTIKYDPAFLLLEGQEIFAQDDAVVFFDSQQEKYPATVTTVNEEEIICRLHEPISRPTANNLLTFNKVVQTVLIQDQLEQCQTYIQQATTLRLTPSARVLGGQLHNNWRYGVYIDKIELIGDEHRLLRDASQCAALSQILSVNPITAMVGPPGSGKTFVSAIGVKQYWLNQQQILLVSHSNKGLDVLVAATAQAVGRDGQDCLFRLGNDPDNVDAAVLKYHRSVRFPDDQNLTNKNSLSADQEARQIKSIMDSRRRGIILACTINSLVTDHTLKKLRDLYATEDAPLMFDVGFFDEATRGFIFEFLYALSLIAYKAVFILDPNQLGNILFPLEVRAYLQTKGWEEYEIERFNAGLLTDFLTRGLLTGHLLRVNRRSLPKIVRVVNAFYDDQLICGRFNPDSDGRIEVFDTKLAQDNTNQKKGRSWCNPREANILVSEIVKRLKKRGDIKKIGGITPYRAQITLTQEKLRRPILFSVFKDLSRHHAQKQLEEVILQIINTVDAFQGSERETIFLSFVKSNDDDNIGFNRNPCRVNVSLSRAQNELIAILNSSTFLNSNADDKIKTAIRTMLEIAQTDNTYRLVQ